MNHTIGVDAGPVAWLLVDSAGSVLAATGETLLDPTSSGVGRRSLDEVLPPSLATAVRTALRSDDDGPVPVPRAGADPERQIRVRRLPGPDGWSTVSVDPTRPNGSPDGSDQREVADGSETVDWRTRAEILQITLDNAPDVLWAADRDGNLQFLSRGWTHLTGADPADDPAEHRRMIHPDDRPRVIEASQEARATGRAYRDEYRIRRPDGSHVWVETRAAPVVDPGPVAWCGSLRDVDRRKRSEDALTASLTRLRRVLDVVPAGVLELDCRGLTASAATADPDPTAARDLLEQLLVRDANAPAAAFGVTVGGPLSGPIADAWAAAEGPDSVAEAVAALRRGDRSWSGQLRVSDRSGGAGRQALALAFPGPSDPPGQVFAILTDDAERVRDAGTSDRGSARLERLVQRRTAELMGAQHRAAEEQAFLRAVTDHIPGMVGYWSTDQVCRYANRAYLEWFGRSAEEVLGHSMLDLMGPDLYELNRPYIEGALRGEPQQFERSLVKASGETGHVLAHYVPQVVDGRHFGFLAVVHDVTPLKNAQQELQRANDQLVVERDRADAARLRFEELFEHSPDAVLLVNAAGTVVKANAAAAATFRQPVETLIGRSIDGFLPADLRDVHRMHRERYLENPAIRPMGSFGGFTAVRGDGSQFQVHVSLGPLTMDDEPLVIASVRDITEVTEAYRALQASNSALEQTALEQQQFLYLASHDLREPLNTITNFSELMLDTHADQIDETGKHFLGNVVQSAHRMRRLLDDLLGYVRLDRLEQTAQSVSLDSVVEDVIGDLSAMLTERGAEVVREPLPTVVGHASLLRVLVQNLVDNASKFQLPQTVPTIRIGARTTDTEVDLVVADNGIGIGPEHLQRVFEIFRRLHPAQQYPGTGIGLAICRRIAQLHRGRIWADSTPGEGTRIHVVLPRPAPTTDGPGDRP